MTLKKTNVLAFLIMTSGVAFAQNDKKEGYLVGSFETNTSYYINDSKTGAISPDDHIGSNNYLKLDYYKDNFVIGAQMESYNPVLIGYPSELTGTKLTNYYVSWADKDFSITAGTFYDQFGSGLLFRSWEDRTLGLNNAIMGARATYNYNDIVKVKAMWGTPRFGMDFAETQLRGADVSFSISNAMKWFNTSLSLEGSVLNRYEKIGVDLQENGAKPYSNGFSARINFEKAGFIAKGEYVDAGDKYYENGEDFLKRRGNAQLLELGYSGNGLGINLSARRLEWMDSQIVYGNSSTSNIINYVPAMCTQYTYALTNLHPYNPETGKMGINNGEMGGQLDVFYNFKRNTLLGGRRGLKIHANFSTFYALDEYATANTGNMLYRDFSADVEKQWSKRFKTNLLYSMQESSTSYGRDKNTQLQNIFVADMLYKFTDTFSTRMELQYLTTQEDKKDWMAGLLELNFAPIWSIYASDMYNNGDTKLHYYNAGISYAKSRTRIALGYGRYKAGYVCSGGVCRNIPAYTGANLAITTSF